MADSSAIRNGIFVGEQIYELYLWRWLSKCVEI